MYPEGIVFAGFQTLMGIKRYEEDTDKIRSFFNNHFDNVMLSFGTTALNSLKRINGACTSATNMHSSYRNVFDKNIFCDSGGFQIMVDLVPKEMVPVLINKYCRFIESIEDPNTYYFIEDVIPSATKLPDLADAKAFTISGLEQMSALPKHKRENIFFVYHFQQPQVFNAWQEILTTHHPNQLLGGHRWAVGGIASSGVTANDDSFITYMYPMLDIIQQELDYLRDGNRIFIHILGVTGLQDILFYNLFESLFKRNGMNVSFTFDSSSAIHSITKGRFVYSVDRDNHYVSKIELRPKWNNKTPGTSYIGGQPKTNRQHIEEMLDFFVEDAKFQRIEAYDNMGNLTSAATNRFILWQAMALKDIFDWCHSNVDGLVEDFYSNKPAFRIGLLEFSNRLRAGSMKKRAVEKCNAIMSTLEAFDDILSGRDVYTIQRIAAMVGFKLEDLDMRNRRAYSIKENPVREETKKKVDEKMPESVKNYIEPAPTEKDIAANKVLKQGDFQFKEQARLMLEARMNALRAQKKSACTEVVSELEEMQEGAVM